MISMNAKNVGRSLGALLLVLGAIGSAPAHADAGSEHVEVSSPLFPRVSVLYPAEGVNFPSTLEGEVALADAAALSYDTLLTACAPGYPDITLASEGTTLTPAELATNYNEVAKCAYETYTVKPYWIPKLVDDVDMCASKLGVGWRLPTEADVASFTSSDFAFLESTLSETASGTSFWGTFYFSLRIFVRGTDGSLKKANLSTFAAPRVEDLGLTEQQLKMHLEGGIALRCIRVTKLP